MLAYNIPMTSQIQQTERSFKEIELRAYDGDNHPMYIAFEGVVYDVTECPHWRRGIHENLHFPGQDLTLEITEAPHGLEVFNHPSIKRVGTLFC
jgi:predicted heme/steroid binding protein